MSSSGSGGWPRPAATLHDPNIVSVFDTGEDSGRPFFVMEYVEGTSLADRIQGGPRLGVEQAGLIGEAVADALASAHRAGVVHGNLTPRDVLIARNGAVKVTDFGTAAAGLAGLADAPVTTAIYSAPERLQGNPPDVRGDLYSLGVMLHEAVTGSPPFTGPDALSITRHKLDEQPLPPSASAPGVPPAFDVIVERLTASNLARRYATADEAAADLRRLREPAAATTRMPIVATALPVSSAPRRSNTGWIVAVALVLLVTIGILVGGW